MNPMRASSRGFRAYLKKNAQILRVERRPQEFSSLVRPIPAFMTNSPDTQISTLPNGLRVASETWPGKTACVGVFINAGSRYETKTNNGAAHFLEHMAFKGTETRSRIRLEEMVEDMGAHLNAYTSREHTVYYAKVFNENVEDALKLLSDMLLRSRLDAQDVEKERDVILREMQEVGKQKEEVILDHLHEVAFQGTGLGYTILGPEENIRGLKREDLKRYITTHYTAPRMVVTGVGAINHSSLVDMSTRLLGYLPTHPPVGYENSTGYDAAKFTGGDKRIYTGDEQTMLGKWERTTGLLASSDLGRELQSRMLCHSFGTFNTCYNDTGLFGLYLTSPPETLRDLTETCCRHLIHLCTHVDEDAVERAKTQLKASMLMQLDVFAHICEDIGRQMLVYQRRMTTPELFARVDTVDAEDVRLCAQLFINDEDHALAAIGPIANLPSYEEIREMTIVK